MNEIILIFTSVIVVIVIIVAISWTMTNEPIDCNDIDPNYNVFTTYWKVTDIVNYLEIDMTVVGFVQVPKEDDGGYDQFMNLEYNSHGNIMKQTIHADAMEMIMEPNSTTCGLCSDRTSQSETICTTCGLGSGRTSQSDHSHLEYCPTCGKDVHAVWES